MIKVISRFFKWVRVTIDGICSRPDHLQRLAIAGAGLAMFPTVWALILIVWRGGWGVQQQAQQLSILGTGLFISMGLWGLVVIALLGIIRGVKASLPGGATIEVDIADKGEPPQ